MIPVQLNVANMRRQESELAKSSGVFFNTNSMFLCLEVEGFLHRTMAVNSFTVKSR